MAQNATKSELNALETVVSDGESPGYITETMILELKREFPELRTGFYPSKYIDRLTIDFGHEPIKAGNLGITLFTLIREAGWVPETTHWNYSRDCVGVTGLTLVRDHR